MDNYQVQKYFQRDFVLLETDWKALEKGKDMSYFQTYDWYESINNVVPSHGDVVFLVVSKNGEVC